MNQDAREGILNRLKSAPRNNPDARPPKPVLSETGLDREGMLERFTSELTAQTGTTYRVQSGEEALAVLARIAAEEGLRSIIVAGKALPGMDLKAFGDREGVAVTAAPETADREALRQAAFTADAGVTFADFAVAETGTVGLIFRQDQPRLVSIAPPVHIAVIPVDKLHPVYEDVIGQVFGETDHIPSQFAFITGPSATADIQAVGFKGMHGPVKVFAIFVTGRK